MMNEELLRLEHVSKTFELKREGTVKAVNEVSLSVKAGECVSIVGESGCGKSTLAKLITYMEQVTGGQMFFDGRDITKMSRSELRQYRRQVQMIFQDPSNVFSPRMKIGTFLMEPWINFEKKSRADAKEEALNSLARVKLGPEYFKKYPHQLSGGELQRVSIARAISLHPKLLLCDEATSALDVSIQKEIISLLEEHRKKANFTILFICHDLALAESFSDRVVVMYLGQIVEILPGKTLKRFAKHPYTKALLDSVFSIHDHPESKIHVLEGEPPSPINLPEGCAFCGRCKFAKEICRQKLPELKTLPDGHQVACHMISPE